MSVRWKPLVILTGLCLVFALLGVMAMALVLAPRTNPLQLATAERAAGNFPRAEIHYRQALQKDGKNPRLLLDVAEFYAQWANRVATDRVKHRMYRLKYLADSAKYGKQLAEPRRQLLAEALRQADGVEAVRWAKELLALDPESADAHYVLAEEAMAASPPNLEELRPHMKVLVAREPNRLRTQWLQARLAQENGDDAALAAVLEHARTAALGAEPDPLDGIALVRLRALDAQRTEDPAELAKRAGALRADADRLAAAGSLPAPRIALLSFELEKVQAQLARVGSAAGGPSKAEAGDLADSIEQVAENTFKKAIDAEGPPDLRLYQAYADHLLARGKRKECLDIVGRALKLPLASMPALFEPLMNLREVAIRAALSDPQDPQRFATAEPYIKELIQSKHAYYEGLGHLFSGAVELEQSGLAGGSPAGLGEAISPQQAKLRDQALAHLQRASEQLPRVSAAQALYGVCLILSQEPALGRQYLTRAQSLGTLEPRYRIWAAWSMVQAGYPEEAEPIVKQLQEQMNTGEKSAGMERTLHLLLGEIHQARRSSAELRMAMAEYQAAFAGGEPISPDVQLRMAQIEIMLGQTQEGMKRLEAVRSAGQGSPSAERLAVLTLLEQKHDAEAARTLAQARTRFPQSAELLALEVAMLTRDGQPVKADQALTDFLAKDPSNVAITQLRARLLAEQLKRADEARALLRQIAERSHNSGPLVQLALLDLERRDFDQARRTIAKIRSRWKEAAAADQLEAQLALAQGDLKAAAAHYEDALKRDPANKVLLLAKAELDLQTGATTEGQRELESIARQRPVKEIDPGLTLATAAQTALAAQALEAGDYDGAIHRLEDLLKSGSAGPVARSARWQLVAARAGKGQWPLARQELAALLNDTKNPPTLEERVRAAQFYRQNQETGAAQAQLDYVLKQDPSNAQAVVTRAYMLASAKPPKPAEAAALVRKAISAASDPPAVLYLVLAALENVAPPASEGLNRAQNALDEGLKKHGDSVELVQAKYKVVRLLEGPKAGVAVVEAAARSHASAPFRRLLAEVYRDEQEYAKAETVVAGLLKENSSDRALAAELVRLVAAQAIAASERGDRSAEAALNDRTLALIRQFRKQFPTDLAFPQAECELALRRGDLARGLVIAQEVESLDHHSAAAPLLRARIFSAQGRTSEVAKAFRESLDRDPNQPNVRIWLAQACLALGQAAEALDETNRVLETNPELPLAVLTKARALAKLPEARPTNEATALGLLAALAQKQPEYSDAYHLQAAILHGQKKWSEAIATLEAGMKAVPGDVTGMALLVQYLAEPRAPGQPPAPADVQKAQALAEQYGGRDAQGRACMALALGFQRAGRVDLAVPWAEKAASKLNTTAARLDYGSLLLTAAESITDSAEARRYIERALEQYNLVLKAQPNLIEAVNNKAWILHRYLRDNQAALELAQNLLRHTDRTTLPGEFFDTLGAIEEALGKTREAEHAYAEGLRKAPGQPVLNFHMARLLSADPRRTTEARDHIERSMASADALPPNTLAEAEALQRKLGK